MAKNDDTKAVVGNIPIKLDNKKSKKKVNKDEKLPLGWRIFVAIMALMMFLSFAGSLIYYFFMAIRNS